MSVSGQGPQLQGPQRAAQAGDGLWTQARGGVLHAISCAGPDEEAPPPDWYGNVDAVVTARCAGCHRPDDIAPFPLTDYDEVSQVSALVRAAVDAGTMPPWQPDSTCNDYVGDFSPAEEERTAILRWIDAGMPKGDAANETPVLDDEAQRFVPDVSLTLPLAYTPQTEPDDYRCQLLDWTAEAPVYLTGFEAVPDEKSIVHHAIAYLIPADLVAEYEAMDAEEEGPGWSCFGGPGGSLDFTQMELDEMIEMFEGGGLADAPMWVGAWAPGGKGGDFAPGTGILVEPGARLAVQLHCNTQSAQPVADHVRLRRQHRDQREPAGPAPQACPARRHRRGPGHERLAAPVGVAGGGPRRGVRTMQRAGGAPDPDPDPRPVPCHRLHGARRPRHRGVGGVVRGDAARCPAGAPAAGAGGTGGRSGGPG